MVGIIEIRPKMTLIKNPKKKQVWLMTKIEDTKRMEWFKGTGNDNRKSLWNLDRSLVRETMENVYWGLQLW